MPWKRALSLWFISRTFCSPFHSAGAPKRLCLVETGLHREAHGQVSGCRGRAHLTASGALGTQGCSPPCQQQMEQTGSIPVYVLTNARPALWQPCCAVADVLHLCISPSQLSQPEGHSHFKQSQEHLGPCSQMFFYLQVEMLVYFCDFHFPVHPCICMGMCSYL